MRATSPVTCDERQRTESLLGDRVPRKLESRKMDIALRAGAVVILHAALDTRVTGVWDVYRDPQVRTTQPDDKE
jgi:hypothetical protein